MKRLNGADQYATDAIEDNRYYTNEVRSACSRAVVPRERHEDYRPQTIDHEGLHKDTRLAEGDVKAEIGDWRLGDE